jgi:plasmid maintenance system antidote protein VapI
MDRLGMSIKDLAKTLDVSYASAFAMAHGNSELHAAQAKRLEDEWGCDAAWLLCLT